jgi:CMP-2-keto-3-deoxyoctulosonic acid synthetase
MKVGVTEFDPLGVDTPEDLEKARRIAAEKFTEREVRIVQP